MKIANRALRASSAFLSNLSITAAFMLFGGAAGAQAQGEIHGTVSDPLGAIVKDVTVKLVRGGDSIGETATNDSGQFTFASITPGRYRVEVQASGFAPYVGPEVFVGSNGPTTLDVRLQITALKDEIVVSATGSEIPLSQVGASISLIDSEDIQAQNKLDVLEHLRQVAGAQIVQTGQRGAVTSLFIRGGASSFNKILVDGVPANEIGGGSISRSFPTAAWTAWRCSKAPTACSTGLTAWPEWSISRRSTGSSALPELKLSVDGGNFGTLNQSVSLSGGFSSVRLLLVVLKIRYPGKLSERFLSQCHVRR